MVPFRGIVYARHLRLVRRIGLQESDACDLVQDVLAILLQKMADFRYDPNRGFRAWLRTVALNLVRERQRRGIDRQLPGCAGSRGFSRFECLLGGRIPTRSLAKGDRHHAGRFPSNHMESVLGSGGRRLAGGESRGPIRNDCRSRIRRPLPRFDAHSARNWRACLNKIFSPHRVLKIASSHKPFHLHHLIPTSR